MVGVVFHEPTHEVRQAHRRLAEALEADLTHADPGVLARHWLEAGDPAGFARWALTAARDAGRSEHHDQQALLLQQLLDLWEEPGVAAAAGRTWGEVAVLAARALRLAGDPAAAVRRCRELVDGPRPVEPLDRAAALVELAGASTELAAPGASLAATDAVRAVHALPDNPDSARLLALAGGTAVNYGGGTRGHEAIEEAAARAARWGLDDVVARADTTLGTLLAVRDPEAATVAFERARRAAERLEASEPVLLLRYFTNAGDALRASGRADAAIALASAGLTWAVNQGFIDTSGAHLAGTLVEALLDAGRLEEASGVLQVWLPRATADRERWWLRALQGRSDLLLGDRGAAVRALAELDAGTDPTALPSSPAVATALLRCELAARTLPDRAVADLATSTARGIADLSPVAGLVLLTLATSRRRVPAGFRETDDDLDRIWGDLEVVVHPAVVAPWAALRAAWRAEPATAGSAASWDAALSATRRRVPFGWRVESLLAAARDCVGAGRTARAGILAAAARELVDGAGAAGLAHDVQEVEASLAREGGQAGGALSPRELDVLRRVAAGASNDDVAHALGISVRTVEVHVGHVMHKLGVRSRGGAVAAGMRLGVLEEDDLRAGG